MNMNRKLQVFISSTYNDLQEERQKCVEAILTAGHIPAGMELFTAGNNSQKEIIKTWIKESDIYMLLLGCRYGSIDNESELSYTDWEYSYAEEIGKPIFSLVLSEDYIDNQLSKGVISLNDLDFKNPKYIDFKKRVMNRMVKFISSKDELKGELIASLVDINKSEKNLVGWIRADDVIKDLEEYTLLINFWRRNIEEEAIQKLRDEAFTLNNLFFPSAKSTPARPVLCRFDDEVGKIMFVIKTPNLYVAEQRRQQFESILVKHDCLISVEIERFRGFKKFDNI